ncbi:acylneuraminate cytidylyltransferase [Microbacterium sp. 4R-513]|uniref:acylneuraminate cytidylyltransferase n=1 Tax=Microbacterium sp. 4R-513 TaxID=2567934 RepID=UPI0013E196E6|nr:acylneuraminate cytidylyltransferase [Microbacterium sp. 4R-513]QIG40863.1 acylneuraminate cytidylyltransferase [Microbacterium sp. 4R-513]
MSEVVAVIPARGGSKGVPRKNLRRVGGVPLVARAVAAARRSGAVDRVVVSTDDVEIAAVAREWGADVVERPADIAGDAASSESAVLHALDELSTRGVDVSIVAFLQATSPFIDAAALAEAVDLVRSDRFDSVLAAVQSYGFLWARDASSRAVAVNHDAAHRPRRQDRDPHYLETGAFYVFGAAGFAASAHRFFGRIGIVEVPERTALEIDTVSELEQAQALAPLVDLPEPIDVDVVVTDFDGVHTDDTVAVDGAGRESVRVSRSDGMGVALLRRAGVPVLILSTETNPVVSARARKLQVEVLQGVDDKARALRAWADASGTPLSRMAYLGNDVNDLACLELVGWPVAVPGAHPLVLTAARAVVDRPGGDGAVRALADRVLAARAASPVPQEKRSAR